jgi:hypothetical protein
MKKSFCYLFPLNFPTSIKRYTWISTRSPGAGRKIYVHSDGPCRVGDLICPNGVPELFCNDLESSVMLHTVKINEKQSVSNIYTNPSILAQLS